MLEVVGPSAWCGQAINRETWLDTMFQEGLECRFAPQLRGDKAIVDWYRAGELNVGNVELAWLSVAPAAQRQLAHVDHLYLKVVQSGSLVIEQNRQMRRFEAGSMVVVDPAYGFKDFYGDTTKVSILQLPRSALRDRGLRYAFNEPYAANLGSEDVKAVRSVVTHTAHSSPGISASLRGRLGQQCLDLLDLVLDHDRAPARSCVSATTVLRTKQVVLRLLADPNLSVARIAAELNISASHLTRALKTSGLSPMRYAWSLRLEHAALMLTHAAENNLQAKEVAYRCGFANATHFSRAFKAKYGMSPRAFMDRQTSRPGGAA